MSTTTSGKALVIDTDGSVEELYWPPEDGDNLRGMYDAIGCRGIELVRIGSVDMWINDEGKLEERAFNEAATMFAHLAGRIADDDFIVGRALLTGFDGPETVALTTAQLVKLQRIFGVVADAETGDRSDAADGVSS
jgi:hypothetical protein